MTKKAILCVTNDIVSDQRVTRSAVTLMEAGWEVEIVGRVHSHSPSNSVFPFDVKRFKMLFEKGKWFYFFFNLRLFFYLLFSRTNLIFSNDLDTLPACFFAARIRGKKLIFDSHELFTEVPELETRPGTKAIWQRIENYFLPRLTSMITVNDSLAKIFSDKYHIPVTVIRNVPLTRALTNIPRDSALLIYQGAINKGRGIELMIAAMEFLPEYRLLIAGRGDLMDEMQTLVKELQLEKQIQFLGHVNSEQLFEITQSAMLGFSLEEDLGMNYRLALPNKIFDYMMAGTPQLVSDLPEMKAVVGKMGTGLILKTGERNPQLLAEYIIGILKDQSGWMKLRENCLKAREEYCWEREKIVLLDFLQKKPN